MQVAESAVSALSGAARPWYVPVSTYRVQFHSGFRFADAAALVPYLHRLGITTCYSSPYLMAEPGSTHGYDICDHNRLNPELGTAEDYESFVAALEAHGMAQTLDFVPNHMGIDPSTNPWWHDVLENGPSSIFASYFDIDWFPLKKELRVKVLLPILGDQYGLVLERGELQLAYENGGLVLIYAGRRLPVNPRQATKLYRYGLEELENRLGEGDPYLREFLSIITALKNLPPYQETDPERIAERRREKEVARERLARLVEESDEISGHIQRALEVFNGQPGRPESFDLLHDLLEAQAYRLAYWRTAADEINYRRFFDINALAGIRMERQEVFDATHVLVGELIRTGKVRGLRLDHPDGLFDPQQYFERLQFLADKVRPEGVDPTCGLYVTAEKILSRSEELPQSWPICGTTGYKFLNELNGLFVDSRRVRDMGRIYRRVSGLKSSFEQIVYEAKKLITESALSSELNVLADALNRISEGNRRSRDFTLTSLRKVLQEVVACFPVYRTYVGPNGWTSEDRRAIVTAIDRARRRNPTMESSIFDFLLEVLLPRDPGQSDQEDGSWARRRDGYPPADIARLEERLSFSMKFQQYTAPVQAKGVEDTAFYRYNLLVSLNEVGGDPGRFGRSVEEFHATNRRRLERWPFEALATSTHDTKLGEDVRARIDALSEIPEEWGRMLTRAMRINTGNRRQANGVMAPDRNDEYRFYQVLLGLLPPQPEIDTAGEAAAPASVPPEIVARLRDYMQKAIKEAKVHTSWINPNEAYDQGVTQFVEAALTGPTAPKFLAAIDPIRRRVARLGALNSMSQLVLKLTVPGVPDIYRGAELWDLSLVDPDNRRPLDYGLRKSLLEAMEETVARTEVDARSPDTKRQEAEVIDLLCNWWDGRIKMFLTAAGLRLRRSRPQLFLRGDYVPLWPEVDVPADIVSFARLLGNEAVVVAVPRLTARLAVERFPVGPAWGASQLPLPEALAGRTWRNVFTGARIDGRTSLEVGEVFRACPVAILWAEGS